MPHFKISIALILVATFPVAPAQDRQPAKPARENPRGDASEGRAVVAQAKAAALAIENDYQRREILDRIGAAEAKAGDLEMAADTANRAYPHSSATYEAIGKVLGEENDLPRAQTIATKLRGGGSSTVFAFFAETQAEKGNIGRALSITERISDQSVRSGVQQQIAHQQASSGDYDGARKTLALIKPSPSDPERLSAEDRAMVMVMGQLSHGDTQAAYTTIASLNSAESRSVGMISAVNELLKGPDKIIAKRWLEEGLQGLPAGPESDFPRYFAISIQVKVGQKERAMQAADTLSADFSAKGYAAVAVACAELRDIDGVNAAIKKMRSRASSNLEEFGTKLNILNITAALLDVGEFKAAEGLLASVDTRADEGSGLIEPTIQRQRVFALAQQGYFEAARSLALKIRLNLVDDIARGTALRTVSFLQTKTRGAAFAKTWTLQLGDAEDRAYALIGIAEALLGIDDVKLPYNTIQIH